MGLLVVFLTFVGTKKPEIVLVPDLGMELLILEHSVCGIIFPV